MREKNEIQEYYYHNTELLLKKYRDVLWSIEMSAENTKDKLESEIGYKLETFIDMTYSAGVDLSETKIYEHVRTVERNVQMLRIIDRAVQIMRKKERNGESYYWIIYFTYLSDHTLKNTEEIIEKVSEKGSQISWKTYFARRKLAIEALGNILWGFSSRDCKDILDSFIE